MSGTRILLLGPPKVERDGATIEVDTRKATALLAYLAVTGRSASRDTLADLLWPEYGQKRARAALRRTLSALSGARSAGWLVVNREDVSLDPRETSVDVLRFRSLLEERRRHGHPKDEVCPECFAPLSEAVKLYRGDFMQGFGLRDSNVFDDWQFSEGDRVRRELSSALDQLSRLEAARGDFETAVLHARRRLDLDRLDESSHRRLMELYALSGRRTSALRQYEQCAKTLQKELGISPLEETTRLHEDIKRNELPPKPAEFRPKPLRDEGSTSSGGSLVGRAGQMEDLRREYARASESGGRLVALQGEAGIGKTRLAEEFLDLTSRAGAVTITARCYPDESGLAYAPLVEVLSALAAGSHRERLKGTPERYLAEASRLAPGLGGAEPDAALPGSFGAQSRFFEGVAQTIISALEGSPAGVLFLDDAQWADGASLDLLSYLVRRTANRRVFVILAYRTDSVPEDHALSRLLSSAKRSRFGTSFALTRFDRESVELLVEEAVGGSSGLAGRLYEETEGLPFLLSEYLAAIKAGEIGASEEPWPLPGGARELLRERLSSVGEAGRSMLVSAAVIGRSFDLETLRESSGRSEEEIVCALEDLERRGLVEEVDDGGPAYDFAHEKLRSLVYEETSLARRRLLHRRVAESLARRTGEGALAARVARHYELAGSEDAAARYFEVAGEADRSLHANVEALSHFRSALALGHPDRASLHERVADLLTLAGDYGAAAQSFEDALEGRSGEGLARLHRKLGGLRRRLGEWKPAEKHYREALKALETDRPASLAEEAVVHSEASLLARARGRLHEAAEASKKALQKAESAGDPLSLARTRNVAAMVCRSAGNLSAARSHLEKSLELSEGIENADIRIAALNNFALVHRESGDRQKALETTHRALDLCLVLGDRHHEAALRNNLADLLHETGREEESRKYLEEAVAIFAEIGDETAWRPEIWKLVEW